jgi:hypothetical protein
LAPDLPASSPVLLSSLSATAEVLTWYRPAAMAELISLTFAALKSAWANWASSWLSRVAGSVAVDPEVAVVPEPCTADCRLDPSVRDEPVAPAAGVGLGADEPLVIFMVTVS